jgi:hypothetical protein
MDERAMSDESRAVPGEPEPSERGEPRRRGRLSRRERIAASGAGQAAVAAYFKERVYATFTGLAIVLVTVAGEHAEAGHAFLALVLGVLGITAAGFASEVISHLAVHRTFPDRGEFARMLRVAGGAMGTVVIPGAILALAWAGVFETEPALRACVVVLIATLAVIGWLAVRRSHLPWWQQFVALALLLALGFVVIGLQTLAHAI